MKHSTNTSRITKTFGIGLVFTTLFLFAGTGFATIPQEKATYKADGGQAKQEAGVHQAIEKAGDSFNVFIRSAAKSRLKDTNPVFATLTVDASGKTISIAGDGEVLALPGKNGEATPWTSPKGKTMKVQQWVSGSTIKRVFTSDTGVKTMTYVFTPDAKALTIDAKVTSKKLKKPLVYRLHYTQ